MNIGFWLVKQRNVGGFEPEYLDLPVNTFVYPTGRDFFHASFWRCLLLVACRYYNGLILQGVVSGCLLRQLPSWGGELWPLAIGSPQMCLLTVCTLGRVEKVTDPHLSMQLLLTTYCRQLCLNYEWPRSQCQVYRPGKTRGRGLNLYRYVAIGKPSALLGKGFLGAACFGRSSHILKTTPHLRSLRKPNNVLGSPEWTLEESCISLHWELRRSGRYHLYPTLGKNFTNLRGCLFAKSLH